MRIGAGWKWPLLIALACGLGASQTGCQDMLAGASDGKTKKKNKKKKKKKSKKGKKGKKKKGKDDAEDLDAAGKGAFRLKPADFDWACATHPDSKKAIHVPKDGEHAESKEKEAARLARNLVSELTGPAGLPPNSIPPVFVEPAVGGSVAVATVFNRDVAAFKKGQRVILFAPKEFVQHVKRSGTTDTIAFIFAHEMGHHVNGHLGHRPDQGSHEAELEADYYAGFLLGKRGTSLLSSTAWVRNNVPVEDGTSHPGRVKRLTAAVKGWKKGCGESTQCDPNQTIPDMPPEAATPDAPPKNPNHKSYSDRKNK